MPRSGAILVLNAGSSSIKFALFTRTDGGPVLRYKGVLDEHDAQPRLTIKDPSGSVVHDHRRDAGDTSGVALLADVLDWIDGTGDGGVLAAVGHRVVHGGPD